MIKCYNETRLAKIALGGVSAFALGYMVIGVTTWVLKPENYGILPSYALSIRSTNDHMYVSLIFFVITTLIEGFIFAYFLD